MARKMRVRRPHSISDSEARDIKSKFDNNNCSYIFIQNLKVDGKFLS